MSAFYVGEYHIDCLLTFIKRKRQHGLSETLYAKGKQYRLKLNEDFTALGQVLVNENVKSINYRYHEEEKVPRYEFKEVTRGLKPIEILKACACYDYQACETKGYRNSMAKHIVQAIRLSAIRLLPEYDNADGWEFAEHK